MLNISNVKAIVFFTCFCYIKSEGVFLMNINSVDLNRPQRFSQFTNLAEPKMTLQFSGQKKEAPANVKTGAALGSLLGTGTVLAMIAKKQGFPINPKVLKNIPVRDWAIFKIAKKGEQNQKLLEIEEKEIIGLAAGSVAGGLAGGSLVDRKNIKAKGREALTQIVGNVLIPVGFVGGVSRIYKKYENQIKNVMPQIGLENNKYINFTNKFIKNIPAIGLTAGALVAGIWTGSKVTNFINEKFFGQKQERKIKSTDFAPHVDDLCLAVTLMGSKDSPVASAITRTVPLFLSVPGYQVGKAQE